MSRSTDVQPRTNEPPWRVQFRLVHLLYAFTVLGASLAVFHWRGVLLALVIILNWASIFQANRRSYALRIGLLLVVFFVLPLGRLLPDGKSAENALFQQLECMFRLRAIGVALQNYHEVYDSLPPAYVADASGRPMHSWRVLILPYLQHQSLYDRYDFSQPWDGPDNRKLLNEMPDVYRCPAATAFGGSQEPFTSYVVPVGPRTAWPGRRGRNFKEIEQADGVSGTILLLDVAGLEIPWTKPRDLDLDEALTLFTSPDWDSPGTHRDRRFFYDRTTSRTVLMADGHVQFVERGASSERWAQALIFDDGAPWDAEQSPQSKSGFLDLVCKPRWDNWFCAGLLLLITILPAFWVRNRPADAKKETS